MNERVERPSQYSWIVYGVAMLMVGGLAGYILAHSGGTSRPAPAAASGPVSVPLAAPAAAIRTFAEAVDAGNRFYDAQRYADAIPYYQKALAFDATDVNVSTDLGTALWYAGRPDAALDQYRHSLAVDPSHARTLFNVGVVQADGKHDYAAAIDAWERLLKANPQYAAADKVRALIGEARSKLQS